MALSIFCSVLGAIAGNLGADGAGDRRRLRRRRHRAAHPALLQRGGFREAFDRKGRLHTLVERMPAYVVTHPQPGLLGAATIAARTGTDAPPLDMRERDAALDFAQDCGRFWSRTGRQRSMSEPWGTGPQGARAALASAAAPSASRPLIRPYGPRRRRPLRPHGRALARDAGGVRRARQGVDQRRHHPARGRDRHRQGGLRGGDPPRQPAPRQAVPGRRLRRDAAATCSRASCSATSAAPSRAPSRRARACSRRRTAAPCSSTRSAS